MNEPIKSGDLVQVVRSSKCCGNTIALGMTFRVTNLFTATMSCTRCDTRRTLTLVDGRADGYLTDIYRLKRIPPLDELEGEKRDEEITA